MKLYNTLSEQKEPLPDQKKLNMFVCGPTVYDDAHIGHARTYIFFDFFAKYLRSRGYEVFYLQNITDVDDKIIKRAAEENKDPIALAKEMTERYLADMKRLGVNGVTKYAPATDFISQIVAQVLRLIEKGFAYEIKNDGWYFDLSKFPDYGALSHRTALQAEDAVSRIDEAADKRNKGDFCLWKFSKPGEPAWPASIGAGRPGWHIEDTAISEYQFGPQYDIHGGGVDLKFPHHEAEIAQQEAASGKKPFVKLWMHTGALLVDGKKMSKSLGNFVTIADFLKDNSGETLRWITLGHHYRSPVDYSADVLMQAKTSLHNLYMSAGRFAFAERAGKGTKAVNAAKTLAETEMKFHESLEDDMNTPGAIATIFGIVSAYEKSVWTMLPDEAKAIREWLMTSLAALGFAPLTPEIPDNIMKLAAEREEYRTNKQFIPSDDLRKKINDLGYEIEDTPQGPFLWPKS